MKIKFKTISIQLVCDVNDVEKVATDLNEILLNHPNVYYAFQNEICNLSEADIEKQEEFQSLFDK